MSKKKISKGLRYSTIRRVSVVGGVVDGLLGVIKVLIGHIGHSQALVADGVHSLSDLGTDILVIWAARHAGEDPDEEHPYGHERIQTIATVVLATILILVGLGFVIDAVERLRDPEALQTPSWLVLGAALFSTLSKEWLYRYTVIAGEKVNSPMLKANAWHHRSDALSSVVVLVGVLAVMAGFQNADALAAIGVALMIAYIGWKLGREAVEELIDTGIPAEELERMRQTIGKVEGVEGLHRLRTRKMGSNVILDAHITVAPKLSVSEGHRIGDAAERALATTFEDVSDITVHVDPEDDERVRPSFHLPLRGELLSRIDDALRSQGDRLGGVTLDDFDTVVLHYLDGSIQVELWLPPKTGAKWDQPEKLSDRVRDAVLQVPEISEVSLVQPVNG
ncbi:MAG: cation diffusion facilitator family transporter [Pseudomonadota bacterium]|nr:cation diffusion facilitator family transporter [Pseudomonadota bacterium]